MRTQINEPDYDLAVCSPFYWLECCTLLFPEVAESPGESWANYFFADPFPSALLPNFIAWSSGDGEKGAWLVDGLREEALKALQVWERGFGNQESGR